MATPCEGFRLGIDRHARAVVVSDVIGGSLPQRGRRMTSNQFVTLVSTLSQRGAAVHSCYEAGPCGY